MKNQPVNLLSPPVQYDMAGGSRACLKAVSLALQEAANDSGMAMGMQTKEAAASRLAEVVTHMKMAARWIDKFLKINGMTYADLSTSPLPGVIISPPPKANDLDKEAYMDQTQRLPARAALSNIKHHRRQHRQDCSRTLFAQECNCRALDAMDGIEPGYYDNSGVWKEGYSSDVLEMGYDPVKMRFTAEHNQIPQLTKPGYVEPAVSDITDDQVAEAISIKM